MSTDSRPCPLWAVEEAACLYPEGGVGEEASRLQNPGERMVEFL